MRIRTQCRACGLPYGTAITEESRQLSCPGCEDPVELERGGWEDGKPGRVEICPLCACPHLYRQRDFNRALGCGLVVVGAVLVPWTYGLSLVVLSLLDLGLYYFLPDSVVCYRCDTVFRDARPTPRQREVDLLKHDVVKYGKTWQDQSRRRAEKTEERERELREAETTAELPPTTD